jgi:hypothetical protein
MASHCCMGQVCNASDLRLLARLILEWYKASEGFAEGFEDFFAQVIPTFFLALINQAKVLKEFDHLGKRISFHWYMSLPAFRN